MPYLVLNVYLCYFIRLVFSVLLLCAFFQPPNIRSSLSVLVCVFACVYRYGGSNGGDRLPQRSEQVSDLQPGSGAGPGLPPRSGLEGQLWLQPGFPGCSGGELASEGGPGEGCVLDSSQLYTMTDYVRLELQTELPHSMQ